MRQIKFRAWDKQRRHMFDVEQLAYNLRGELVSIYGFGRDFSNDPEALMGEKPDLDKAVLMQFTGLHDKNGREIYEGDIVHVWDNGVAVVIFDESLGCGQWMCKFKPAFPDFEEWSAPLYGWLDGNVDGSVFEILGNVYETQELNGGDRA